MNINSLTYQEFSNKINLLFLNKNKSYKAHKAMMPEGRVLTPLNCENTKQSAVLIAFYKENNKWIFPLIERTKYIGVHSGQMALPGGKFEEKDINLEQTAIREANEEIGILPDSITIKGQLTQVYIPVSNHSVLPIVGLINTQINFKKNTKEVSNIYKVELNELLNPNNIKSELRIIDNKELNIPYFLVNNKKVWGATAMILNEMKELFT